MLTVRLLTSADFDLGMRLKEQAGWNQTRDDWRRSLELEPTGCFVGVWDGAEAATLATAVFGDTAWIAMVLTDEAFRGRGIASGLMRHALEYLEGRGVTTVRLDATSLGRPVYEKFGFQVDYELTRFGGVPNVEPEKWSAFADVSGIRPLSDSDVSAVTELDQRSAGCDRSRWLDLLRRDDPAHAAGWFDGGGLKAFVLGRAGSHAAQVGPSTATNPLAGVTLLRYTLAKRRGVKVFVDIPNSNRSAIDVAQHAQLMPQRPFYRMSRGRPSSNDVGLLWASSGPEYG